MDFLNQSRVKINDTFTPMLQDLQANIIEHHGRDFAYHILLQITDADPANAWIANFSKTKITSAFKQLHDSSTRATMPGFDGGTIYTLSLSTFAYGKLDVLIEDTVVDDAFREGMKKRLNKLRDELATFEEPWKNNGDIFIIVADANHDVAKAAADQIISETSSWSKLLVNQKGHVLRNKDKVGIEHFNYADGVSQPLFTEKEIMRQRSTVQWNDEANLSILLKKDPGGKTPMSFGSFLVFRKLEQNIRAFKTAESKLIPVKEENGDDNRELGGAMIVGRFENGSEVVNDSEGESIITPADLNNDFDYRDDLVGTKCPFHAHIRMTNPRASRGVHDIATHRIARRGIPFSDAVERDPDEIAGEHPEEYPESGYGLLFMCYQSIIENQFEVIQHTWANDGEIGNKTVGQDGIIGQGPNNTPRYLPEQWGQPKLQTEPINFGHFVTTRGGEYFFTPSKSFLESLKIH